MANLVLHLQIDLVLVSTISLSIQYRFCNVSMVIINPRPSMLKLYSICLIFTASKRSYRMVMLLHLSVILFTGGVYPLGRHPLGRHPQADPQTPGQTPPGRHSSGQTSPWADIPPRWPLKWVVTFLLECILVVPVWAMIFLILILCSVSNLCDERQACGLVRQCMSLFRKVTMENTQANDVLLVNCLNPLHS